MFPQSVIWVAGTIICSGRWLASLKQAAFKGIQLLPQPAYLVRVVYVGHIWEEIRKRYNRQSVRAEETIGIERT